MIDWLTLIPWMCSTGAMPSDCVYIHGPLIGHGVNFQVFLEHVSLVLRSSSCKYQLWASQWFWKLRPGPKSIFSKSALRWDQAKMSAKNWLFIFVWRLTLPCSWKLIPCFFYLFIYISTARPIPKSNFATDLIKVSL